MRSKRHDQTPVDSRAFGYSVFSLRLWHGMTLDAWLRTMRGKWHMVSPRFYPLAVTITLLSIGNLLLKYASIIIFGRRLAKVKIVQDPIFIIGHWRSGTTWLHQIMASDPRNAAPDARACFCPETFLVGRFILTPILRLSMPKKRPMDNVELDVNTAEEDEIGICLSGAMSPFIRAMFPNDTTPIAYDPEDMDPKDARVWRAKWLSFLRRVQYVNPGKRLVLKSPPHTLRTREILRQFPNARFIHILRDPYKIFLSNQKRTLAMHSVSALQDHLPSPEQRDSNIIRHFVNFHEKYHKDREHVPDGQLTTVRYEDLRSDTVNAIRNIYQQLDLGDFSALEAVLQQGAKAAQSYQTNQYDLDDQTCKLIETEFADYFQRYDYLPMADRVATDK